MAVKMFEFQFHNGSIKRMTFFVMVTLIALFQFHNGSIKSGQTEKLENLSSACFNSTMVRLKVEKPTPPRRKK